MQIHRGKKAGVKYPNKYKAEMRKLKHTCGFTGMGNWVFVEGCPKCEFKRSEYQRRKLARIYCPQCGKTVLSHSDYDCNFRWNITDQRWEHK